MTPYGLLSGTPSMAGTWVGDTLEVWPRSPPGYQGFSYLRSAISTACHARPLHILGSPASGPMPPAPSPLALTFDPHPVSHPGRPRVSPLRSHSS